jgi:predicted RNA-binding protein YlxR (DUF448 family)
MPPKVARNRPRTAKQAGRRITPDLADNDAPEPEDGPESGPIRRCAVTRERLDKTRMIRFVLAPDATVVPDLAERLPGRGIWLSARGDVLETARTRGAFARAARQAVKVPPTLLADVRAALLIRIGETLGLARRAGAAVAGFAKAREWLEAGRVGLVVQASDGSPEERKRFLGSAAGRIAAVTPLSGEALGRIFGRDHVVHVAVAKGRLAERLHIEAERLAGVDNEATTETDVPAGVSGRARATGRSGGKDSAGG